ncbi:MAG TPA: hypothetical protein VME68_04525 [Acidobacteriaceae bacterium]|nr:hypothetical protein [Acidobacteriaceae bacterium]
MNDHQHQHTALIGPQEHDPLRKAERETPSFNRAWLKNGENLTILQRAGFTIFSLVFLAMGLFIADAGVIVARGGDLLSLMVFVGLICVPSSLGCLTIGILGVRNVLRFPKNPSPE